LAQCIAIFIPSCVMASYSPQQVLRLVAHMHEAFSLQNFARFRSLCEPFLLLLRFMRPTEVAMTLNHLAHARLLDGALWQPISDALPALYVDADTKAVSIAANAYARALLKHESALEAIARCTQTLASHGRLDARSVAMLINAYSKLRAHNVALMNTLMEQLPTLRCSLNAQDLANVANGLARMTMHNEQLFDTLRGPLIRTMSDFDAQNLAMIVNAYARMLRRDDQVLSVIASEIRRRCEKGQRLSAKYLPSMVHAYAVKLSCQSEDFARAVEISLPEAIEYMGRADLVLTVPSLRFMSGLEATPFFRRQVFGQCVSRLSELTYNAVVSILEAAVALRHDDGAFWAAALSHCEASLGQENWLPRYLALLSGVVSERWVSADGAAAQEERLLLRIVEEAQRTIDAFDLRDLADLAEAVADMRVQPSPGFPGVVAERAHTVLSALLPVSAVCTDKLRMKVRHGRRLRVALCKKGVDTDATNGLHELLCGIESCM